MNKKTATTIDYAKMDSQDLLALAQAKANAEAEAIAAAHAKLIRAAEKAPHGATFIVLPYNKKDMLARCASILTEAGICVKMPKVRAGNSRPDQVRNYYGTLLGVNPNKDTAGEGLHRAIARAALGVVANGNTITPMAIAVAMGCTASHEMWETVHRDHPAEYRSAFNAINDGAVMSRQGTVFHGGQFLGFTRTASPKICMWQASLDLPQEFLERFPLSAEGETLDVKGEKGEKLLLVATPAGEKYVRENGRVIRKKCTA